MYVLCIFIIFFLRETKVPSCRYKCDFSQIQHSLITWKYACRRPCEVWRMSSLFILYKQIRRRRSTGICFPILPTLPINIYLEFGLLLYYRLRKIKAWCLKASSIISTLCMPVSIDVDNYRRSARVHERIVRMLCRLIHPPKSLNWSYSLLSLLLQQILW